VSRTDAFVAATRFGLGARRGELAQIGEHARDWLEVQLVAPDPHVEARLAALGTAAERVEGLAAFRGADPDERKQMRSTQRDDYVGEHAAHLAAAAASTMPFRERLVAFWANHLTVSISRREVLPLVGPFEREVVRPNLDGAFADLVVASAKHPAMLAYLDNARSIGPDSWAGRKSGRGLNENYARELLELHTVGVAGGYGQADVEALAALLTGWTLDGIGPARGMWPFGGGEGGFVVRPERHQPGAQTVLGRSYTDPEAAIRALAAHPSTARHVATRLARHFVADDPPPEAVAVLAAAFTASGGHLPAVHRALIALPGAWQPLTKVKSPWDLVMSTQRALGGEPDGEALLKSMRSLGQLPYQAPSPQGWPDRAEAWIGGGSMLARLEWAELVARRARRAGIDAEAVADDVIGPVVSARTRRAIAKAPETQALAVLIASPEFQRR
jgi:uncharacterized protein (DUF1800 family)